MQNNKNTVINIVKIGKYIVYINNMLTGFMKASIILSSFFIYEKFNTIKISSNVTLARKFYIRYNLGHNTLELYTVLVQVRFETTKMRPDI